MRTRYLIAALAPFCFTSVSLAAAGPAPASAKEAAPRAQQFLADAIKGNNSEILLGELATRRGSTEGIRQYGETLQRDHGKAKENAVRVARLEGWDVPSGVKPDAQRLAKTLQGLSGKDFDREFLRHMILMHREDISKYENAAKLGGKVGAYAQQTLPDLRKHLEIAQRLNRELQK